MVKAVRIREFGAPDVMQIEDITLAAPGPGEALVRHTAIGLNYLDTYHRHGHYPMPLPSGLGVAGAGVIEAIGPGVTDLKPGDRVAYAGGPPGSYAEARIVGADRLVPVPAGVDDRIAAATLQQGITARFLLKNVFPVKAGDTILFHAAAGGLGTIACQWAKKLGATVIGTVGSDAKAAHALAHGCDHVIVYSREDVPARVAEITGGKGVSAVYDSVGKDTFDASLRSLAMFGTFVSFGYSSGNIEAFDPNILGEAGSLSFARPRYVHYVRQRSDMLAMANDYFGLLLTKQITFEIGQTYRMDQVAQAHAAMEGRATIGSSVLVP